MGQNHRTEDAVMNTELEPEELHAFSFFDLDVSLSSSGPLISVRTLSHSLCLKQAEKSSLTISFFPPVSDIQIFLISHPKQLSLRHFLLQKC